LNYSRKKNKNSKVIWKSNH